MKTKLTRDMKEKSLLMIAIVSVLAILTLLAFLPTQTTFAAKGNEYWLGYRMPDEEWINGNLSPHKDYAECDWVPYQLIITTDSKVWKDPEFGFINWGSADIGWTFWSGSKWDAIYVDMLGDFYYKFDTDPLPDGDPGSDDPYKLGFDTSGHPGWMEFTPAILNRPGEISKTTGLYDEVPENCEYPENDHFIRLTPGVGGFPSADEFETGGHHNIVVYFKAHLALDILWKNGQEAQLPTDLAGTLYQDYHWTCPHRGSSHYQGSASHFFLQFKGLGAKTIPIPIAAYPEGIIQGHKYVDVNGNGVYDNDDYPYTEGWRIDATATIYAHETPIIFSLEHQITDETGFYQFTGLVEGTYAVDEVEKTDWIHTGFYTDVASPDWDPINGIVTINLARGQTATVDFLNIYWVDLMVSKDVTPYWQQTLTWEIVKTATPEVSEIFVGDTTDVKYTITVTAYESDNVYEVSGTITIYNPNPAIVKVYATILDEVWYFDELKGSQNLTLVGPIPPGESTYDYSITLLPPIIPGETYINKVTVEVTQPVSRTYMPEVPFWFTTPTEYVDDYVDVEDSYYGPIDTVHFSEATSGDPWTFEYIRTFGPYPEVSTDIIVNTAYVTGDDTGYVWEDSATVAIHAYDITVSKDAYTWWKRVFDWSIEKFVEAAQLEPFINDEIEVRYTISVEKDVLTDTFKVYGTITIVNNNPEKTAEVHVYDKVKVGEIVVPGTETDLLAHEIPPGGTLSLEYEIFFTAEQGVWYTNEVQVYLNNYHWDHTGMAIEFLGTTEFTDSELFTYSEADVKVHDSVTVTDEQIVPAGLDLVSSDYPIDGWPTNADATFYVNKVVKAKELGTWILRDEAFAEGDEGMTWRSGEKTLIFDVYDIAPSKTAEPWWEQEFDWTIDKSVEPVELTLLSGETGTVTYTITIRKFVVRNEFKVYGTITIVNNNPEKTAEVHVYDKVKDRFGEIVPGTYTDLGAWEVEFGLPLVLDYEITFEAVPGEDYTNEVQVYLNNYHWNLDLSKNLIGTTEFTAAAGFTFDEPTSLIDDSAIVEEYEDVPPEFSALVDYGPHGSPPWTVTDSTTIVFTKYITAVSAQACVWYELPNTVTLTESDTHAVHSAEALVRIHIPYTATVGYWKNHPLAWPDDPYPEKPFPWVTEDWYDTWLEYPSYMDILWTPVEGDASIRLAQQYIAAVLNGLQFGVPPYIEDAIAAAEAFFTGTTDFGWPPYPAGSNPEGDAAAYATYLAGILEDYNSHGPSPP